MEQKKSKHKKNDKFSRRRAERLGVIFFIVEVIIIAFVCGFGFLAYSVSRSNIRSFYANIGHSLIERHVDYFDDFFSNYFDDLQNFSELNELKSGDIELAVETLRQKIPEKRVSVVDVLYAAKNGQAESISGKRIDVSNAEFFKKIFEGEKPLVFDFYDVGLSKEDEYVIAKGVENEGEKVGVVFYSMRLDTIFSPVSGMTMGDIFSGFVIKPNGDFIIPLKSESILNTKKDYLNQDDVYSVQTFFDRIAAQDDGVAILNSTVYPDEFIEWAKIDKSDWVLVVEAPLAKIDQSMGAFKNQIIILCLFLILCTLIAVVLIFIVLLKKNSSHRLTLQQDSDFDDLTGLWTEALFEEKIEKLLKENPNQNYLLMGLDIRGFRIVQQTEGISTANEQLIMLSKRLNEIARLKNGFASRGHIDHFYVIYPISDKDSALKEFDSMLYNGNFLAGRAGELVPTKTGIVFVGKDYEKDTIHNLIGKTSYAKHMVQDNLLKNYFVYDDAMEKRIINDKRIERYIPIAFSHDEFYVVYQPKINLTDGKIMGAEALVRWASAELGTVMPDAFITLFERNGYINRLDFYVYKKVFEFLESRIQKGKTIVPVSVNMSRFHLSDDKFVQKFYNLFRNYNIPPEMIEVEILERSLGIADDKARFVAEQLHEKGFRVAIDDFGTGESSLNLISKIPADILKLDRKFMRSVEEASASSDDEFKVVKQIVEIAKSLGKETICEGVETEKQINFLRSINCNYVQGFFYSKPLAENDFVNYLEKHL